MHNLVLITSEFPYFAGEPFLLNELPYLSESFKEIYIFSINGSKLEKTTRDIPQNARCFPLGNTISKSKYIKYTLAGLKTPHGDLRINEKNPKRIVASLYTRGRAAEIANQIIHIIKDNKLQVDEATVYSFWFAYQAVSAWMITDKLRSEGIKTKCVSRAHGYDLYWERATGGFQPFQDVSLRNLNYCFPCSEFGTTYLLKKYPWAKNKIKTERLGTKDYGLNRYSGEKTFVTCCNLEPLKRMSLFAEAFCEIAETNKNVKWICIGSGEEEASIRTIAENADVISQVELTGRLSNKEVLGIYKKEGILYFCNVSTSEGLPVSIMEAMSFGIPIIATDVGGTSELVSEDNGMLISSQLDRESLVIILQTALKTNSDRYYRSRRESRKKWEQLVSADVNYTEFCSIISNL